MLWMDLEETNKPMSSEHRVSVNSRGPRTKPCEYWWQKARGEVLVLLTQERVFSFFCFSNMGVLRVMKEMKLSCCKCHFEFFFTTVANDEEGHPPIPFDILFHTHNDSYNSQTEPGSILHLHISHNTPCLPPKHFVYALSSIFFEVTVIPRRN